MNENYPGHWDHIYASRQPQERSWTEEEPFTSLQLIRALHLPQTTKIIDVGGGDSRLVDYLLEEGYENITVLDISGQALDDAKRRLGKKAELARWIHTDILDFDASLSFDLWHDRAAFHFLTTPEAVQQYLATARKVVTSYLILGTFSEHGPAKCSGLPVQRYNKQSLSDTFSPDFEKIHCVEVDHTTPAGGRQSFVFCQLKKVS